MSEERRKLDAKESQCVGWASDSELLDELIRRTQMRLEMNPCWAKDDDILKLLYDAGKLLVIRYVNTHKNDP